MARKKKRKASGKGCFAKVSKQCSSFSHHTGRSYHKCMSGALKRKCYGGHHRGAKRKRGKCVHGVVQTGPRKGLCRTHGVWQKSRRSGGSVLD